MPGPAKGFDRRESMRRAQSYWQSRHDWPRAGQHQWSTSYSLIFKLYNIGAPGTYPLGTQLSLTGGTVVVSKPGSSGWSRALTGAAGQIVITSVTASRISGTFSFTGTLLSAPVAAVR